MRGNTINEQKQSAGGASSEIIVRNMGGIGVKMAGKKILCMALLWTVLLACVQWAGAEVPFVRLEDSEGDDPFYSVSLRLFEENEPLLYAAAEKMLETQTQRVIWYYSNEDGEPELSVWNEIHGQKERLSEEEYPEYYNLARATEDTVGIFPMYIRDDGVVIELVIPYSEPMDVLNSHTAGYYFVPEKYSWQTPIEDVLKECMPEEWESREVFEDEGQFVWLSDSFIYYHWQG